MNIWKLVLGWRVLNEQIYKRASEAYEALSTRLGEQKFLFEDRFAAITLTKLALYLFKTFE